MQKEPKEIVSANRQNQGFFSSNVLAKKFEVRTQKPQPGTHVVVPISSGSDYRRFFSPNKLAALFEHLEECAVTVVIADTLGRWNKISTTTSETEAHAITLAEGEEFVNSNREILEQPHIKVVRWDEYLAKNKAAYERNKGLLEEAARTNTKNYYNALQSSVNKCSTAATQDLKYSVSLLIEESAAYLTFNQFQSLWYPRKISDAFAFLYKQATALFGTTIPLPKYVAIRYIELKPQAPLLSEHGLLGRQARKNNTLPFAMTLLVENLRSVIESGEFSEDKKLQLKEEIENLFISSLPLSQSPPSPSPIMH